VQAAVCAVAGLLTVLGQMAENVTTLDRLPDPHGRVDRFVRRAQRG
jgi:hypothetical protein